MKRWMKGILVFTVTLIAAYHVTVFLTPYLILLKVKAGSKSEFNHPVYASIITDKDRNVALPNPDFLYVACGYDIRKTPVHITGTIPDSTYSSLALYSSRTLNYFCRNDRQAGYGEIDILLVNAGDEEKYAHAIPTSQIVPSPTSIGIVLMRILIDDSNRIDYLKEVQHTFRVEEVR